MQISATSSVDAPYVLVERFRKGLTQIGVVFYVKNGAAIDLTGQQFIFEINDGATAIVQVPLIGGLTQPASNKLLITLDDAAKTKLRRNGYSFTLYNLTRERMELTGVLNWKSRSANATAVTTAPDVRLDIDTVTGTVTINGVVFQGQQGPQGYRGWNPVLGVAVRGNDRVWQLLDYSGGEGVKPTEFLGWYVGYGGYVQSIDSAVNVRGLQGIKGDVGTRWFVGNADPIAQAAGNAASFAPNAEAAVGDIYLNADTGSTYKLLGSGNWSQQNGNLRGPIGWKGWCPVYALIVDGARTVKQLIDWTAGEGLKPTAFIGQYLGATGYVPNIANAVDLRGPKGDAGTLTASAFVDILPLLTDKLVYKRADGSFAQSDPSTGYPTTRPTLLLDFAGAGMVSPLIQHIRAGVLSYIDRMGVMRYAPANVPALEYDPANGRCLGLSAWGARTNFVRNSMMVGAIAGSPGTLPTYWNDGQAFGSIPRTSLALVTELGIACVDLTYSGTATSTQPLILDVNSQNYAVTGGQVLTGSLWTKITGTGPTTIEMRYTAFDAANNALTDQATANVAIPLTTLGRVSFATPGMPANTTSCRIWFVLRPNAVIGNAYNFTLRVGGNQVEVGIGASPVIPTSGAVASRTISNHYIDLQSTWFKQGGGTFYVEVQQTTGAQNDGAAFDLWQDSNNKISLRSSQLLFASTAGGGTGGGGYPQGSIQRLAFRYAPGDVKMYRNGSVSTTLAPTAIATGFTRLYLGTTDAASIPLNGYIRAIRYYPALLTDSELIAITSY